MIGLPRLSIDAPVSIYTAVVNFKRLAVLSWITRLGVSIWAMSLPASGALPQLVFTKSLTLGLPARGVVIDRAGNAIVVGSTDHNYPVIGTPGSVQPVPGGGQDAWIMKFAPNGDVVFKTHLGGSGDDVAQAVAVDASGNIYVTGYTWSSDFPIVNALFPTYDVGTPNDRSSGDAFVVKLNPDGSAFFYSTYLGGKYSDRGFSIKVDDSGNAYVGGFTYSPDYPLSNPFQNFGPIERNLVFTGAGFITKINEQGSNLVYSTFFGSSSQITHVTISDLAIDASGSAYVTGGVPRNYGPVGTALSTPLGNSSQMPYVAKLAPSGSQLVYASFLPSLNDGATISVDAAGAAYVITHDVNDAVGDSLLMKVNPSGTALVFSKTIPGNVADIAVDDAGALYIAAFAQDTLPSLNAVLQRSTSGPFLLKLEASGSEFNYATSVTNSPASNLPGGAIAIDQHGNVIFAARELVKISNGEGEAVMPHLSSVSVSEVTINSAKVSWMTDIPADSQIEYGKTSFSSKSPLDTQLTILHSRQLTGLTPGTEYRFRATSMSTSGNIGYSMDATFQTLSIPTVQGNPVPMVTSIQPPSVPAGSATFTARLRGSNFLSVSTVRIGSRPAGITFVDSASLEILIPADVLTVFGTLQVTVENSAPGGGSSSIQLLVTGTTSVAVTAPLPISEVESGDIRTGYIVVTPETGSVAPSVTVTYGLVKDARVLSQAGILSASLSTDATLFVDVVRAGQRNLGIAFVNPNQTSITLTASLQGEDGLLVGQPTTFVLPGYGHLARFVDELVRAAELSTAFRGSVRVQSSSLQFAMMGLRFTEIEFSTMPVAATTVSMGVPTRMLTSGDTGTVGGAMALIFPQFTMGGGWNTQVALVNSTGTTMKGRIDVFGSDGTPLIVRWNGAARSTFTYTLTPRATMLFAPRDINGQSPY